MNMNLHISTGPHLRTRESTRNLMLDVLIALLPTTAAGIYLFGLKAAWIIVISIASAVIFEYLWQKLAKRPVRVGDLSAVVTGLILGLNLPANVPYWMPVVGSAFAIIIVKQLFGGIGHNFLNPALAARAVLLTSWPAHMAAIGVLPQRLLGLSSAQTGVDVITTATPLSPAANNTLYDLMLGNVPGAIGEVCKIAIIIGFLYLVIMKVINWQIPVIFVAVVAAFTAILGGDPLKAILTGGVLFGAVFMATDYVTNPMLKRSQAIFATGCGIIVVCIRQWGVYPEGVTYAILLMNILTPLIDKAMKRRIYGEVKAHA